MEHGFADLLSNAFSETSVPSFSAGDLDFEDLNFDFKDEEDKTDVSHENLPTKEDEALHQEATGQTAVLSSSETKDVYMGEHLDNVQSEEDFQGVGVMSMDKTPEEDYTSSDGDSEEGSSLSGEDEEDEEEDMGPGEEPGELSMSAHCSDEFCDGNKEDRIIAEGQPLAPEGAENPQVRNEEQGDSDSDEEVSYFKSVPERGSGMNIKGDWTEEDKQENEEEKAEDSSDCECEGMKIEREENVLEQEVENPCRDGATASLEFPDMSLQNLQDLIAEVDSEVLREKMKDFSGEEHQEAGESFADYPSDFSSCEYVEDGGTDRESNHQSIAKDLETAGTDMQGRAEVSDEEGNEYLYSIDLEVDADKFGGLDVASGEKHRGKIVEHVLGDAAVPECDDGGETSDSYSSTDDEAIERRSDEEFLENVRLLDLEFNKSQEELHSAAFAEWNASDSYSTITDAADFNINRNLDMLTTDTPLSDDLLTAEATDKEETLLSNETLRSAEGINTYSVVRRADASITSPSNQGSLDDSFFFNTERAASGVTELGPLVDDDYEVERNWEQEQERIKAFYDFYNDSDGENTGEGRQIKVQFCTNPLLQVIHYETESSDRDSLSSSTEGEEDLSPTGASEELKEPDDSAEIKPICDPPNAQRPDKVPDLSNTPNSSGKHRCLNMMKVMLKMGVVIVTGLLMFWLATDQAGWLSQGSFF